MLWIVLLGSFLHTIHTPLWVRHQVNPGYMAKNFYHRDDHFHPPCMQVNLACNKAGQEAPCPTLRLFRTLGMDESKTSDPGSPMLPSPNRDSASHPLGGGAHPAVPSPPHEQFKRSCVHPEGLRNQLPHLGYMHKKVTDDHLNEDLKAPLVKLLRQPPSNHFPLELKNSDTSPKPSSISVEEPT